MSSFEKAVFEIIGSLNISEDKIINHKDYYSVITNLLLAEGETTQERVFGKIIERIYVIGRRSYEHHINSKVYNIYPDHTISPQCLAYTIFNGRLSMSERKCIKYNNQREVDFLHEFYFQGFPEHIFQQFICQKNNIVNIKLHNV